jgi:hypothetical protein
MSSHSSNAQSSALRVVEQGKHRLLRVLSGMHTGAESAMQAERVLVGNLEDECDIMLNVGLAEPHACLLRMSADGWTVLSVAGNLWVNDEHVELQKKTELVPGAVVTLGRVAFAISDSPDFEWSKVRPPFNLIKPDPSGPLPSVAMLPSAQDTRRRWLAVKLAAGIGISCLVMASAAAYVTQVMNKRVPTLQLAEKKLVADKEMIASLPAGKEVSLTAFPEIPGRVLVQGYVASSDEMKALTEALKKAETDAEIRVTSIDELTKKLVRRFDRVVPEQVRYDEKGRFVVNSRTEDVQTHDKQARTLLQEVPSVAGLDLSMSDMKSNDGTPLVVKYNRSAERPSDVTVSNLDAALGRDDVVVRELRTGAHPSVVLGDGARYFAGGRLTDGTVIKSIDDASMVIARGQGPDRVISLTDVPRTSNVGNGLLVERGVPVEPGKASTSAKQGLSKKK